MSTFRNTLLRIVLAALLVGLATSSVAQAAPVARTRTMVTTSMQRAYMRQLSRFWAGRSTGHVPTFNFGPFGELTHHQVTMMARALQKGMYDQLHLTEGLHALSVEGARKAGVAHGATVAAGARAVHAQERLARTCLAFMPKLPIVRATERMLDQRREAAAAVVNGIEQIVQVAYLSNLLMKRSADRGIAYAEGAAPRLADARQRLSTPADPIHPLNGLAMMVAWMEAMSGTTPRLAGATLADLMGPAKTKQ